MLASILNADKTVLSEKKFRFKLRDQQNLHIVM